MKPRTIINNPIDAYGLLSAEIADLQRKARGLKQVIVEEFGEGTHEGTVYQVAVSFVTSESVNKADLLAYANPPKRWLNAHTDITQKVVVRASARSRRAA